MPGTERRADWFVGGYTADSGGNALGIGALATVNDGGPADGSLEYLGLSVACDSPSYLAASHGLVYAASEAAGAVEVFRRVEGYRLEPVGRASAGGESPCHVARYDDLVVAACYGDGRLGVLSADPLGLVEVLETSGRGPHPAQDRPHAHSTLRLDERTVLSADLGADRVHVHRLENGRLQRSASLQLPAGGGPRDLLRHPSGHVYVLGELGLEVLVLEWRDGELRLLGATALPGAEAGDHASALSVSADGRFVWAGLRGSNRISVLAVDAQGSALRAVTSIDAEGDWPRHHVVDGDVMHVAHEKSATVASFRIGDHGIPSLICPPIAVPTPIFLLKADSGRAKRF